jgi:hypothetical protein
MPNIYIEDYTTKSFVVRGETRDYKDSIKSIGGKWNSSLTDRESGDKFGAWLFWNDKRVDVQKWIDGGCTPVQSSTINTNTTNSFSSSSSAAGIKSSSIDETSYNGRMDKLEKKIDYIIQLLENMGKNKQPEDKDEIILEQYEEDTLPKGPVKRLLGAKKK